jgi:prophage antirepressor-like protein
VNNVSNEAGRLTRPLEASSVSPFDFEGYGVRVVAGDDGEAWFVAMEISAVLEYSDAFEMTKRLDDDDKQNRQIAGFGNRGVTVINESGLYAAIIGSKKPEAKKFKRWVTNEVLPSIRKTGRYEALAQPVSRDPLDMMQMMLDAARADRERIAKLEASLAEVPVLIANEVARAPVDEKPAGTESMSKLKRYWNSRSGLPEWVVEYVLRQSKEFRLSPTAIVKRDKREGDDGEVFDTKPYPVYQVGLVTCQMNRFLRGCVRVATSRCKATHPAIDRPFNLHEGLGKRPDDSRDIAERAADLR